MATIGKNILDSLTTGMYQESKIIYREYIQNACDQIDIAMKEGILLKDSGIVDIFIDPKNRYISIKDNATGVKEANFRTDLGDIANSNKKIGENKGFRGIGRLCGLAYCKTLKFTTTFKGETIKSIMTCDAKKMREMLESETKYTVDEILDEIVCFSSEPEELNEHYFNVEMFDIRKSNADLLDVNKIKEFLYFVAPVPYKNTFYLRTKIYDYAKIINYKLDEYKILVNGEQLFKEYTTNLKEPSGNQLKNYDEISQLEFKTFYNENNEILAWMWVGLSRFEKQIPPCNQMRGLRLRTANIQIGNDSTLRNLFKETRGNYYFIGEVFSVDHRLIPNSQRDYFNENETKNLFEDQLRGYFYDTLHKIYYNANEIKNAYKKQSEFINIVNEYNKKNNEKGFINIEEKKKLEVDIEKAKFDAEKARKTLNKYDAGNKNTTISKVNELIRTKYNGDNIKDIAEKTKVEETDEKPQYVTQKLSKLSRSERKIVSKILEIVTQNAPQDVAETIVNKIKEALM